MTSLLKDKIILVTGAGDGIGSVAAKTFAAHGATVVLLGKTIRKLERVYDAIEKVGHPQPAIYPFNLEGAAPKDYLDLAEVIEREFGHLDGLLHNAAMLESLTPLNNYNLETWYKSQQVNLNAPFLLTQALLGLLNQSDDASLVYTLHDVSDQGNAYWGSYAVCKGGLKTLMKMLANELESNTAIRVNGIDPGIVNTGLRRRIFPSADQSQWAEAKDIMSAYLYLFGDESKDINGQIIKAQEFKH